MGAGMGIKGGSLGGASRAKDVPAESWGVYVDAAYAPMFPTLYGPPLLPFWARAARDRAFPTQGADGMTEGAVGIALGSTVKVLLMREPTVAGKGVRDRFWYGDAGSGIVPTPLTDANMDMAGFFFRRAVGCWCTGWISIMVRSLG